MEATTSTIIWTWTDEAPMLASVSFLPMVRAFVQDSGVSVETADISLAGRIIAAFPERVGEARDVREVLRRGGARHSPARRGRGPPRRPRSPRRGAARTAPAAALAAQVTAGGTGSIDPQAGSPLFGEDDAHMKAEPPRKPADLAFADFNGDGTADLAVATIDMGSGQTTTLCQIAAEALGLPFDAVRIVFAADTETVPFDAPTHAGRVTYSSGNAVQAAADTVNAQWNWYFSTTYPGSWVVSALALNPQGSSPPPSTGDLTVTASTTGSNLDPDGYTVTVDGGMLLYPDFREGG